VGGSNSCEESAGREWWDFSYAEDMVCGRPCSVLPAMAGGLGQLVQVEVADGVLG